VGDVWLGRVWACILTFVWLRGKIRVGQWCCEVVGSCEVEQAARCSFLLPLNLIKTCVRLCVHVTDVDECRTFPGLCKDGSTCINTVGSFTCQCPAYMVSDFTGLGCVGKSPSASSSSFTASVDYFSCLELRVQSSAVYTVQQVC